MKARRFSAWLAQAIFWFTFVGLFFIWRFQGWQEAGKGMYFPLLAFAVWIYTERRLNSFKKWGE